MGNGLKVKMERDFGDVIGDGMKIVFRNVGPIFIAIMWFSFPFIAISMVILIVSGAYKLVAMPDNIEVGEAFAFLSSFSIVGIGLIVGFIMINLIVYVAVMDYNENEGIITFEGIKEKILRFWKNYFLSIATEGIIMGAVIMVIAGSLTLSPVLFSIVYFAGLLCLAWIFNIIQFLGLVRIEEGLSIVEGINRCFYLLKNNWWSTFGVILVSSFIGTILMYAFILPISIIIGLLSTLQSESNAGEEGLWISILSGVFVILYALIAILSNMYVAGVRALKYYDLIERKEAKNLVMEIENIGSKGSTTIFENEGDF